MMKKLVFIIKSDNDGGYVAKSKLENGSIITQGDDLQELKEMIKDAIEGYFFDKPDHKPKSVLLKFEEVLALA
jgi:predicted RNase H-like HicB family nuclease